MQNQDKHPLKVFVILTLVTFTGCVALRNFNINEKFASLMEPEIYKERPVRFNHESHMKEGVNCDYCHPGAYEQDDAQMPETETCAECHYETESADKSYKRFYIDGALTWTSVTRLPDDVIFSHEKHAQEKIGCEKCHRGIEKSVAVSGKLRNSKDECMACHVEETGLGQCGLCHQQIDQNWTPASHKTNWQKGHGFVARTNLEPPFENRCAMCHKDSSCTGCHQINRPSYHNGQWRRLGHSISAGMDRSRCATCHKSDYCDRCHRADSWNHPPKSGSKSDPACIKCH
jgi:Cytochrome c3